MTMRINKGERIRFLTRARADLLQRYTHLITTNLLTVISSSVVDERAGEEKSFTLKNVPLVTSGRFGPCINRRSIDLAM